MSQTREAPTPVGGHGSRPRLRNGPRWAGRPKADERTACTTAVAVAVLAIGYAGGGYSTHARTLLAVTVWAAIAVAVAAGADPRARVGRYGLVTWGAAAAYAAWTAVSQLWAPDPDAAFAEVGRVTLYLGLVTLVVLLARRATAAAWADGIAFGIVAITAVALASRFFPSIVHGGQPLQFLWGAQSRLSYPVGYWTGLGVLAALALPLLLRGAVGSVPSAAASARLIGVPVLSAALYLTSARLGVLVAVLVCVVFLAAVPRVPTVATVLVAAVAAALSVAAVRAFPALSQGPFGGAAQSAGWKATLLLAGIAGLASVAHLTLIVRLPLLPSPSRRMRRGWWVAVAAVVLVAVLAVHPVRRFDAFRSTPAGFNSQTVGGHLLSDSSNGRWQLWVAAAHEARSAPLVGRGAGGFGEWWQQHGLAFSAKDAHSIWLTSLGDLGIVGLLVLAVALGTGLVAGIARVRRAARDERALFAALLASFVGYLVAASVDWMWTFTIVSVVGFALLGLLCVEQRARRAGRRGRGWRAVPALGAVVAAAAIAVNATELLADSSLRASAAAATHDDAAAAMSHALDAVALEPWATAPRLQVALVEERQGHPASALRWIDSGLRRDRHDWELWLVRARLETAAADVAAARRSLARARALNPYASIFAGSR